MYSLVNQTPPVRRSVYKNGGEEVVWFTRLNYVRRSNVAYRSLQHSCVVEADHTSDGRDPGFQGVTELKQTMNTISICQ